MIKLRGYKVILLFTKSSHFSPTSSNEKAFTWKIQPSLFTLGGQKTTEKWFLNGFLSCARQVASPKKISRHTCILICADHLQLHVLSEHFAHVDFIPRHAKAHLNLPDDTPHHLHNENVYMVYVKKKEVS